MCLKCKYVLRPWTTQPLQSIEMFDAFLLWLWLNELWRWTLSSAESVALQWLWTWLSVPLACHECHNSPRCAWHRLWHTPNARTLCQPVCLLLRSGGEAARVSSLRLEVPWHLSCMVSLQNIQWTFSEYSVSGVVTVKLDCCKKGYFLTGQVIY